MLDSEIPNVFNEKRKEFKLYGLTCEIWKPNVMRKADRHNEVEINYISKGSITYLFKDSKITIPAQSFTVFWGLIPHQIVDHTDSEPYYVCTVPLSIVLGWKLPSGFVDKMLNGDVLIDKNGEHSNFDEYIINNWIRDFISKQDHSLILMEIQARLFRMSERIISLPKSDNPKILVHNLSKVEQVATYIAQHYRQPIKAIDIGNRVGLHPDYANAIFKKAFGVTINEYIVQERISHAQRELITTDKPITDILYESGFYSISRFNAAFRKINKCTPREFRKEFQ